MRAHEDRPGARNQGVAGTGGEVDDAEATEVDPQTVRTPAFPDRKPRRRARTPSKRPHKLTIRLSDTERDEIAAAAKEHTITVAGFLAAAGLAAARGRLAVRPDRQLAAAIDELAALRTAVSRVGNNINQIAHVHNAGGQPLPGRLDRALRTLLSVFARIDDAADALVSRRS
ncbi:plasmid mobilization relaxosome protein MobC [Streptomyces sp. HPF1205]|uniref:plasmid mobilization protein n=1 Tax=Streptomyces sp. HPF1205 TaxID=2873262 RepID=UPI001CECEF3C|nr:plasmid mobilization relaxosome protein MobC [Streptomyces sp. HPF1205]